MRILLTGRSGQLGTALVPALAELGEVAALGRAELDLTDGAAVDRTVAEIRPELIVNAAAYTAVDSAEAEPELAHAVNAEAPGRLARAAAAAGAALVHYSTDYVFDGEATAPYREDAPTAPVNEYGRSKLAGERAVAGSGAPHLIIRTSWLYGPVGRNFLTTMLRLGGERDALRVVADQVGSPTSTLALAEATRTLLARGAGDLGGLFARTGGVLHAVCRGSTSWHGFAEAIFDGARRRGAALAVRTVEAIPTAEYPTPARRPRHSVLDPSRLESAAAHRMPDWRAALDEVLDAGPCVTQAQPGGGQGH